MNKIYSVICLLLISFLSTAGNNKITVKITNVIPSKGKLVISIITNEKSFNAQTPEYCYAIDPTSEEVIWSKDLPEGEYAVSAYQDINGNDKIDTKLFVPKEPFGFSNYNGKGIPNFQKNKFYLDSDKELTIHLYTL